jgi:hypothetical protein
MKEGPSVFELAYCFYSALGENSRTRSERPRPDGKASALTVFPVSDLREMAP